MKLLVFTCEADRAALYLTLGALDTAALQAWLAAHAHDLAAFSLSEMDDRRSGTDRRKGR